MEPRKYRYGKGGVLSYVKVKDGGVYASDVDDTLLMWNVPEGYLGPTVETSLDGFTDIGIPNIPAIKHLKKMKARGFSIIVWSAGGSEWAEAAVKALKLERYVDVIMPKIDFHLDDKTDPKDKIGVWNYINLDGDVFCMDKCGKAIKMENSLIDKYGGDIE